jgi:hypothetical protein
MREIRFGASQTRSILLRFPQVFNPESGDFAEIAILARPQNSDFVSEVSVNYSKTAVFGLPM